MGIFEDAREGHLDQIDFIGKVIAFILHAFLQLCTVMFGILKSIVESGYEFSKAQVISYTQMVREDEKIRKYKDDLIAFILKNDMGTFFKRDDPFLDTLVQKANKMKENPDSTIKSDNDVCDLIKLSLYQQVIYCDDSRSMLIGDRIEAQRQLVRRIAQVATYITPDEDGVELRFVNSSVSGSGLRGAKLETIMTSMQPTGETHIGTNLIAKVLKPLVYDKLENRELKRPVLVSIITDGCPKLEAPDTLRKAIRECKRRLIKAGYEPETVLFQVSQVGSANAAKRFFNGLRNDEQLKRILYCTPDKPGKENEPPKQNDGQLEEWVYVTVVPPDELSVVI
ncbi:hypothetical protein F5Y11DRAFT_181182 [Daldinia sp. FL1419]|nr:hypothetical protein F5Y11DRAFT_181182 [Daldinia sp. FL1419]